MVWGVDVEQIVLADCELLDVIADGLLLPVLLEAFDERWMTEPMNGDDDDDVLDDADDVEHEDDVDDGDDVEPSDFTIVLGTNHLSWHIFKTIFEFYKEKYKVISHQS